MTGVILTVVLAVLFTLTGSSKVLSRPQALQVRDQLGIPADRWKLIGALELLAVVGLLLGLVFVPAGIAAAAGVAALMVGAAAFRLRARAGVGGVIIDGVVLVLAVVLMVVRWPW